MHILILTFFFIFPLGQADTEGTSATETKSVIPLEERVRIHSVVYAHLLLQHSMEKHGMIFLAELENKTFARIRESLLRELPKDRGYEIRSAENVDVIDNVPTDKTDGRTGTLMKIDIQKLSPDQAVCQLWLGNGEIAKYEYRLKKNVQGQWVVESSRLVMVS